MAGKPGKRKRGQGEGTLFRAKSGLWIGFLSLGKDPVSGKRCRKKFTGETAQQVRDKMTAHRGKPQGPASKLTVADLLERWLETVGAKKRISTQEHWRTSIERHIKPGLGQLLASRLTLDAAEAWLSRLGKANSAWVCRPAGSVLKQAVKWASSKGRLLPANPIKELELPSQPEQQIEVYTVEEVGRLLAALRQHKLYALFVLAVWTGARRGELLGLHWDGIDLDAATIHISRTVCENRDGSFRVEPPKTRKSRRTIDLPAIAIEALQEHRQRLATAGIDTSTGIAFPSRGGRYIYARVVGQETLRLYLKRAGLPFRRFHVLRHTHASILLANGVNIRAVSERLGHSSAAFTLSVYSHLLPGAGRETARAIDRIVAGEK